MDSIRIIIADDHVIVRTGLCKILEMEDDIEVVAEASDGFEAIEKVKQYNPDLVLMDMRMPKMNGAEAIKRIREFNDEVKFIILTTYSNEEYVFDGIKAGARGFLLKDAFPDEIISAIRKVNNGESLFEPTMITKVLDRFSQIADQPKIENALTNREMEVLQLIADGSSNKEIAAKLFISIKTVKTHVTHIFEKLGVSDRTEAVTKALRLKIIEI